MKKQSLKPDRLVKELIERSNRAYHKFESLEHTDNAQALRYLGKCAGLQAAIDLLQHQIEYKYA